MTCIVNSKIKHILENSTFYSCYFCFAITSLFSSVLVNNCGLFSKIFNPNRRNLQKFCLDPTRLHPWVDRSVDISVTPPQNMFPSGYALCRLQSIAWLICRRLTIQVGPKTRRVWDNVVERRSSLSVASFRLNISSHIDVFMDENMLGATQRWQVDSRCKCGISATLISWSPLHFNSWSV